MKRFLVSAGGILIGSIGTFAQDQKLPDCPTISVTGPAGVTMRGEMMTFVAEVKGSIPAGVEYEWTVMPLPIVSGQGTTEIRVLMTEDGAGRTTVATLAVKGLPEGCPNNASESVMYCVPLAPIMLDEITGELTEANKARLRQVVTELENNPNNQLYIIETFKKGYSSFSLRAKVQKFKDYLVKLKLDESRITVVTAEGPEALTRIYRIPPGAMNPTP